MDKPRCENCVWMSDQVDEHGIFYCWILHCKVYSGSMPCKHYERNDDKHKPF